MNSVGTVNESGLTITQEENFGEWYSQLVTKAKLIHYTDISGCYVLLPNSYHVWEAIQHFLDNKFKKNGVKNSYFPLFISYSNLCREKDHVEGFTPEVAWVTHAGHYDPKKPEINCLEEPLAIRPTSECAMYSIFPNLIKSYHDLPLKYNQWCNVVRWEFKDATPFIRSREFLWQEGHTCHATKESAREEMWQMIDIYKECYEKLLAVPVIKGYKTEKEKFAGADITTTIEGFIPTCGKAVQAATSHCLGQNFSKMFNIMYQNEKMENCFVWQNSWGFTTRSIGVMLMTHSDNKGVVFPPRVAPIQCVIIPIYTKKNHELIVEKAKELYERIKLVGIRVELDLRQYTPGWKYNYWELVGVPVRIELGNRDIEKEVMTVVYRHNGMKQEVSTKTEDNFNDLLRECLNEMQTSMYNIANDKLKNSLAEPTTIDEFTYALNNKKMVKIPFCNKTSCENTIKELTGAKSLCILTDEKPNEQQLCVSCSDSAEVVCLFGRSY